MMHATFDIKAARRQRINNALGAIISAAAFNAGLIGLFILHNFVHTF